MPRRYLIVGLGAAAIAAAESIRAADPAGEILLVSDDPHGYYSRPGLAYYLTGEIPDKILHPFSPADWARLNVKRLQARVAGLHPAAAQVELEDGRRLAYDRLLLATGSLAVRPALPGLELEGVVKLDDMADARQILARSRPRRAAVVIGGGITALELVEGLCARGVRCHYFLRQDRYWPGVLDEAESRLVEDRLRHDGVQIHPHTEAAEIVGRRGRVLAVRTTAGAQIACDMVAVAVGVQPRAELAIAAGLRTERGVLVDEYLQSSEPTILAAGDAAQVWDPLAGKAVLDTLWPVAVAQGRAAGATMAGRGTPYRKAVPLNVTRLAGLTTTILGTVGRGRERDVPGIARGDSETWRQLADGAAVTHAGRDTGLGGHEGRAVNHVRLLLGERTLLGAVVMGDQTLVPAIHQLIARQADISSIREQLLQPGARPEALLAALWNEEKGRHEAR